MYDSLMKRLFLLLVLAGLGYGGYLYYQRSSLTSAYLTPPVMDQKKLVIADTGDKLSNLAAVLGASVTNTYENGKEMLSDATNGASEPIINQLVSKTQETLKDLPRKEAEKIKYEFCRGVVTEYENKSTLETKE